MVPDPIDLADEIFDAVDWNDVLGMWLQPLATVITGLLAVLAAAIAYRAVTRQIKANAENVQKQIDAAAAQQQKNRDAEWARMRRNEVLDLLQEARELARGLAQAAKGYSLIHDNPELFGSPDDQRSKEWHATNFTELTGSVPIVSDRLDMHELDTVSESLQELENEAGAVIQNLDYGEWTIPEKEQAVFDAIKDALREPPS